jgi:putative FmdB family regulatory protein
MPIYEYLCGKCNLKFEQLVRTMDAQARFACPKCGSEKTARTLSVFAVGTESGKSAGDMPSCGRCGGAPGSCGMPD